MSKVKGVAVSYKYPCLAYKQRQHSLAAPSFCLFHAPAGEILKWVDIDRLEARRGGKQRSLNNSRVRSIRRFLENEANTIPSSIVIAFRGQFESLVKGRRGTQVLELSCNSGISCGTVIDGQHRLQGVDSFDPAMEVNVVGLLGCSDDEAAFQFLVINNKAARVSTDHIKALIADQPGGGLAERLRSARLSISQKISFVAIADSDPESPFRGLIDWPINRQGRKLVLPSAIEMAIRDIETRLIREFEEIDVLVEFFFAIWRTIKEEWPQLWGEGSKLLEKVGIVCMTQFLTNIVANYHSMGELDVTNLDEITKRVKKVLSLQQKDLWTESWASAGYDTQAGRKLVLDALVQISRNLSSRRPWSTDVALLVGGTPELGSE
jgi:DGQHR domain-containing protein